MVEDDRPLPAHPAPVPTSVERSIGRHVAGLVEVDVRNAAGTIGTAAPGSGACSRARNRQGTLRVSALNQWRLQIALILAAPRTRI